MRWPSLHCRRSEKGRPRMKTRHYVALCALSTAVSAGFGAGLGCGASADSSGQGGHTGSSTGNGAGAGTGQSTGASIEFDAGGSNDAGLDPDSACATQSATATLSKKPVDVIVVIDNSGSMTQEIVGVQANINKNFATILDKSGLDYRVIMVSRHGSASGAQSVCIESPLSGIPVGGCAAPPKQPVNNP